MLKEAGPHVTNAITLIQSCFIGGDLKNSLVPVVNESFICLQQLEIQSWEKNLQSHRQQH